MVERRRGRPTTEKGPGKGPFVSEGRAASESRRWPVGPCSQPNLTRKQGPGCTRSAVRSLLRIVVHLQHVPKRRTHPGGLLRNGQRPLPGGAESGLPWRSLSRDGRIALIHRAQFGHDGDAPPWCRSAPRGEAGASGYTHDLGRLAQLGERQLDKLEVAGSSPAAPTLPTPSSRAALLTPPLVGAAVRVPPEAARRILRGDVARER
jgi:hypothetical protein